MIIKTIQALFLAFFLPAAAAAQQTLKVPVDENFDAGDLTFDGELGTFYRFLWDVKLVNGTIAVCGVGKTLDPTTSGFARRMLRQAKVTLNGKPILTDISFFTMIKSRHDLASAAATCQQTGFAPPKGDKAELLLDFGYGTFRH